MSFLEQQNNSLVSIRQRRCLDTQVWEIVFFEYIAYYFVGCV